MVGLFMNLSHGMALLAGKSLLGVIGLCLQTMGDMW